MIKTYKCEEHGEFNWECDINQAELQECPMALIEQFVEAVNINMDVIKKPEPIKTCNKPVKRVFKPIGYSWKCDGFCGRGFDIAK